MGAARLLEQETQPQHVPRSPQPRPRHDQREDGHEPGCLGGPSASPQEGQGRAVHSTPISSLAAFSETPSPRARPSHRTNTTSLLHCRALTGPGLNQTCRPSSQMHPGWPQEKIKDPEREMWALSGSAMGALGANEHPVTGRTQEDIGWSSALHSVLAKDTDSGVTLVWVGTPAPPFIGLTSSSLISPIRNGR